MLIPGSDLTVFKQLFWAIVMICLPLKGMGQTHFENRTEGLESSFRVTVSTQFLIQRPPETQSNTAGFANQKKLFYQRPVFGVNFDWFGWPYVALKPRFSYYSGTTLHFEDRSSAMVGIPGLHEDTYDFRLFLLEPGLKISLPFKHAEVFWSGGLSLGLGRVILEEQVTPVLYENGEMVPRYDDTYSTISEENSRDIGFYFSTGISLPISSTFRIQAEIGYRRLNLEKFDSSTNAKLSDLDYRLDSFTPGLGISYMIR